MGVSRLIVVAETDDEAMSVARRAYRLWFESINLLWRKYEVPSPLDGVLPEDFLDWHNAGAGFAGTPAKAMRLHRRPRSTRRASTTSVPTSRSATSPSRRPSRTVDLFERDIIPAFDPIAAR